jgi:hypothetical protein
MCKLIRFLYLTIPLHGFRDFLIQKHLADCPRCQKDWTFAPDLEKSFAMPVWINKESSLWPHIKQKLQRMEQAPKASRKHRPSFLLHRWQWATTGLALIMLVGVILVVERTKIQSPAGVETTLTLKNPQIKIIHAEIQGKKAKTFIFQTTENLFIWFDEIDQEED